VSFDVIIVIQDEGDGKFLYRQPEYYYLFIFLGNDVNAKDDNDHTCVHAAACSG